VKAKIDNVKSKIQDKEERRTWSRPTLAKRPVFGQLAASATSFPLEEPPRQVSASHESLPHTTSLRLDKSLPCTTSLPHDKSLPRTTSLRLDKSPPHTGSPPPTGAWAQTHSACIATDACGGMNLHIMREQQLVAMQVACPGKSLNAGLTGCTAITSPSSPALPHASTARGTQAPSTMRTSLDLGSGVAS
jgi:hypothetical protein